MRKLLPIIPLLIILAGFTAAEGVIITSPNDGTLIQTSPQTFIFTVEDEYKAEGLENCSLYANGEFVKSYNFFPSLTSIRMNVELDQGTYVWFFKCYTEADTVIISEERTVEVEPPPGSTAGVTKKVGSGLTTAGTRWLFDIKLLDKGAVTLTEIRPLDIIEIALKPATHATGGFQPKDEYIEIIIVKASIVDGKNYLDIKARTSENQRVIEGDPLQLDVDMDEKEDILFSLIGKDRKKNIVEIMKIDYIPAEPEEEPDIIIEEEEEEEPEVTTGPEEEPEEEEVVEEEEEEEEETIVAEPEEKERNMTLIVLIVIVIIVVVIGIYLYASGTVKVTGPPKKKKK